LIKAPGRPELAVNMMKLMKIFKPERVILSGVFIVFFAFPLHATDESINPSSWVYNALRRFELLGLVEVSPDMPMSRSEAEGYVYLIEKKIKDGNIGLKGYERFLLERLKEEFAEKGNRPSLREDRPVVVFKDNDRMVMGDVNVGGQWQKVLDREKGEIDGTFIPEVTAGLGSHATLQSNYLIEIAPEVGSNKRNMKPSPRLKSFRGITSLYERGYIAVHGNGWRLNFGRDYLNFGSSLDEGLLISRTAGSFDKVSFDFSVGRLRFKTLHAVLEPEMERRLAGHRLIVSFPRGIFIGIGETVLYTGRGFDITYLMPFSAYYANQFNERGDDNILWSVDWKAPIIRGVIFYGEFLIDDLQYEREEPAPDRIGTNIAVEAMVPLGPEYLSINLSYTYIDIFTYAHKDSLHTCYVTGDGRYPFNPLIGSSLGPDADRWRVRISYPFYRRFIAGLNLEFIRRGEGNNLREWDRIEDPDPKFPSRNVLSEKEISVDGLYDLKRGSYIYFSLGVRRFSCEVEGVNESRAFGKVGVLFDL